MLAFEGGTQQTNQTSAQHSFPPKPQTEDLFPSYSYFWEQGRGLRLASDVEGGYRVISGKRAKATAVSVWVEVLGLVHLVLLKS